jgi:hypothetical protein
MTSSTSDSEKTAVNSQPSFTTAYPPSRGSAEPPSEMSQVARNMKDDDDVHVEKHSKHGDVLKDIILGASDGLTVPFALTAGLSSWVSPFSLLFHD